MKRFYRMILIFAYVPLTISLYTLQRSPKRIVASFNQRLQDLKHSSYSWQVFCNPSFAYQILIKIRLETSNTILLPLSSNTILYISFLWFVFQFKTLYHKERGDNDRERLGLGFPQISHNFLYINATTPLQLFIDGFVRSHNQPSPQMNLLKVTPNLIH